MLKWKVVYVNGQEISFSASEETIKELYRKITVSHAKWIDAGPVLLSTDYLRAIVRDTL